MRGYQKSFLIAAALVITLVTVIAVTNRNQKASVGQQSQSDDSQLPIVDYSAPNLKDANGKTNRDRRTIKEEANVLFITESESLIERLPALPSSQSNVIVVGNLIDAHAYLTNDNRQVRTKYTLRVDQVLKNETSLSIALGSVLSIQREGGRVRFPSGHIQTYLVSGQGVPRVGQRHLFFLDHSAESSDFLLLTAYELRANGVVPVDDLNSHRKYEDLSETEFLKVVRQSLTGAGAP